MRLLETLTGRDLSADSVAGHLERVGFPVEEIIELLPYDPQVRTAKVTGVLKHTDNGVLLTVETDEERYYAYSHVEVAPEGVVAIGFIKSPLAEKILADREDAAAAVLVEKDLGLEEDRPVVLPPDTPLGVQLSDVIESTVLDVEVTPNRGDLYSVYGLARELSVLWGERFVTPPAPRVEIGSDVHPFRLEIEAEDAVHQYYGFAIDGVGVAESPFWLRWMLHAFGVRPVNNVVDCTNYVMFLTGQPLHAFDAARIRKSVVKVRRAKDKERFTAIDHKCYALSSDCLLIADENHPLAIAGVMGGVDSEVSESAIGLFLESAEFRKQAARGSIEKTGLRSESGKRFAAGIDGAMVRDAALVFIDALAEMNPDLLVSGELAYGAAKDKGSVSLGLAKLDSYAAKRMDPEKAKRNLELIGFEVDLKKDSLRTKVPSHRNDILEDVDLIEEVLRLSGYDDLPSRFGWRAERRGKRHPLSKRIEQIRNFCSGLGLSEVYSLSLIPMQDVPEELQAAITPITNPLSERMSVLRPSLLPGMLAVVSANVRFGNSDLGIYEIGQVFTKGEDSPSEKTHLGILLTGNAAPLQWDQGARRVDFFDLKGIVEMFFERFGIKGAHFEPAEPGYFEDEACLVKMDDAAVIELGRVSSELLEHFDIAGEVYFCESDLAAFEAVTSDESNFEGLPRFSPVKRDMALLLDANHSAADVVEFVRSHAGPLCTGVDVFDSYVGDPLPPGKRNLGLRLCFMPRDGNLPKEELDRIIAKTGERVVAKFNALVRGRESDGS